MAATGTASSPLLADDVEAQEGDDYQDVSFWDIYWNFTMMGWTAFGGPQAHIGMFETTLVEKFRWMSGGVFLELFALCSCLPGPTSTQVAYAIGAVKKGFLGGIVSGTSFIYPGFSLMAMVGWGAGKYMSHQSHWQKGIVDGLAAVGLALVAVAGQKLVHKSCKDSITATICLASAVLSYLFESAYLFPALILAGGLITLVHHTARKTDISVPAMAEGDGLKSYGLTRVTGTMLFIVWLAVLLSMGAIRATTDYGSHWVQPLHWFESFYRIGSIIYGGGQVVLPMLITEVCQFDCHLENGREVCVESPDSWVTVQQFKAGLAIIQAMPGPMFNLSAYLGAVIAIRANWSPVIGSFVCALGLIGSGAMIMFSVLPFWGTLRKSLVYRRALPGFNSAAVGLVVCAVFALYSKFTSTSIFPKTTTAIGIIGFCMVDTLKVPAPFAIIAGGVLGLFAAAVGLP